MYGFLCRLEDEEERRATLEKLESVSRENNMVKSNLTSKEQELELKMQENEDLAQTISRLRVIILFNIISF